MDLQRPYPFLAFLSTLLAGATAAAASPQEKAAPELHAPAATSIMRTAHGAAYVDGDLWGGGPDYKVLFRDGGFELTPALGRAAPRNFPLAFELEAIERGGVSVLPPAAAAAPALGADGAVSYAHAGGIEERYELRADGVEQSFVFTEPLPGTGELVVRGRLASALGAPLGEHAELDFTAPGLGGVRFGAVTGIDAAGRTVQGSLRFDGETLALVLPASLVDAAQYPLVLDPLIGAAFVLPADGEHDEANPDVAYDGWNTLYLVAWQREFSSTDFDIHAQRVSTSGALVGGLVFIENASGTFAINPTVASVRASRRFVVAWQEKTTGSYDIKARAVNATDGGLSPGLTVAALAAEEIYPDACGEQTTVDDDALVVWEREDEGIFGAQIQLPITGNPSVVGSFSLSVGPKASRPAIAKSLGTAGRALVTYNYLYIPGDMDVHMRVIDRNGLLLTDAQALVATSAPESDPDVDGDGTSWLVAHRFGPHAGLDSELFCQRMEFNGSSLLTFGPSMAMTDDSVNQYDPTVAWTPGKAFVAWQEHYEFDLFDTDIYMRGVDPFDCGTCEPTVALDFSPTWDAHPTLVSQYSGGSSGDQLFASWYSGISQVFSVDQTEVKAQLFEAFGSGGSALNLGGACGAGGLISTSGSIAAGNPGFAVTLSGADPFATVGLLVVKPPSVPFVCGSCSVILGGTQFTVPMSGGAASKTLPIPCDTALVGAQLEAQWAVLPTFSVPCALFGAVAASARLRLTIGQ